MEYRVNSALSLAYLTGQVFYLAKPPDSLTVYCPEGGVPPLMTYRRFVGVSKEEHIDSDALMDSVSK